MVCFSSSKGLIAKEILEDGSVTRSASRETTELEENNEVRASLGFKIVPEKVPQLNPRGKTCEQGFLCFQPLE